MKKKSTTIDEKIFDALTKEEQQRILEAEEKFEKNKKESGN